jgi:hypothetical protein
LNFADPFDALLARDGPPAIFTTTSDGELKLDLFRTRDAWQRVSGEASHEICHCLFRDDATGFVQYVLATSLELVRDSPRATVARFPTEAEALDVLRALGRPPLCPGNFPP